MNWSLTLDPLLSWTWIALVLVPVALAALAGLLFRRRGALFRLAAALAVGAALLNPVLLDEQRDPLQSVAAIIVDRSQSQEIGERRAQTDQAVAGLKERLARFKQFDVRVVETGQSGALEEHTQTRLFGALESAPNSRV